MKAIALLLGSGLVLQHPWADFTLVLQNSSPSGVATTQDLIPGLVVSPDWLNQHLNDPKVRVIATGDRAQYDRGHIPGARFISHEDTISHENHALLGPAALAAALARAGATDDARIVLYGDSPMTTGWLFMALASIGHGDHVSMLDGTIEVWRLNGRTVSTTVPPAATGRLAPKTAADVVVAAPWVRERLEKPGVKLLDVRSDRERANGYLPGSTLVIWRDLFSDPDRGVFKSRDEIRALLTKAGVGPTDQVVTYCAIGMRASLMYFAARYAGFPARVYVGSFDDWSRQSGYPIVRRH
jgi:thiosulfate/3-mercaptopyruvate sulfurtransferase